MSQYLKLLGVSVGVVLLASACSYANPMYLPDGRTGILISCNGSMNSWGTCANKVSEICGPRGYEVISRNESEGVANVAGTITPMVTREMVVVCGAKKEVEKEGERELRSNTV